AEENLFGLTPESYRSYLQQIELQTLEEYPPGLRRSPMAYSIRAREHILDVDVLRAIGEERLRSSGVRVISRKATENDLKAYDFVVIATYEALNELVEPAFQQDLLFELVEEVVVKLPDLYKDLSLVIFGDAMTTLDPRGSTGWHVLAHRSAMIHSQ